MGAARAANAAISSTSLIAPAIDDSPTVWPIPQFTGSINVPMFTNANVIGTPGCDPLLSVRIGRVGIVVATDHRYPIFVERWRQWQKSGGFAGKRRSAGIWHSDKQGGITVPSRLRCPMGDHKAAQAVRDQNRWCTRPRDCLIERLDPILAHRMIPITLHYAGNFGVFYLPQGLPMSRTRVADAGHENNGAHSFSPFVRSIIYDIHPELAHHGEVSKIRVRILEFIGTMKIW